MPIKAVADTSRGIMALGGDLHADDGAVLLADGSSMRDLWGIKLYPGEEGRDWIRVRFHDQHPSPRRQPLTGR